MLVTIVIPATVSRMKYVVFLLAVISCPAQAAPPVSSEAIQPGAKLHADVVKFIEASGAREGLKQFIAQALSEGKARVIENCNCDPAFAEEWAKRMAARTSIDDYLKAAIQVYERHFTDEEILQLTAIQNSARNGQAPVIPEALKKKMTDTFPTVQSEIMGATTQIGAKLGAEIGMEIQKEHPEYFKTPVAK